MDKKKRTPYARQGWKDFCQNRKTPPNEEYYSGSIAIYVYIYILILILGWAGELSHGPGWS